MPRFSSTSRERLETCHPKLQELLNEAIKVFDFTVLKGHRSEEEQNDAYVNGNSTLKWPESKHNKVPSHAVDIAPYPIDWNNITRFAHLQGFIRGLAYERGINVRFGCDWDMDGEITDHDFMDWPHLEILVNDE